MTATKEQLDAIAREINRHYIPYGNNYKQTCLCGHTLNTDESLRMHIGQALLDSGLVVLPQPSAPPTAEVEAAVQRMTCGHLYLDWINEQHVTSDEHECQQGNGCEAGYCRSCEQAKQREAAAVAETDKSWLSFIHKTWPCSIAGTTIPEAIIEIERYYAHCKAAHDNYARAAVAAFKKVAIARVQTLNDEVWSAVAARDIMDVPADSSALDAEIERATKPLRKRVDQLDVQLAGCLTAAEGWSKEAPAKQEDYGWSPAYQAVLDLRRKHDAQRELVQTLVHAAAQKGHLGHDPCCCLCVAIAAAEAAGFKPSK